MIFCTRLIKSLYRFSINICRKSISSRAYLFDKHNKRVFFHLEINERAFFATACFFATLTYTRAYTTFEGRGGGDATKTTDPSLRYTCVIHDYAPFWNTHTMLQQRVCYYPFVSSISFFDTNQFQTIYIVITKYQSRVILS